MKENFERLYVHPDFKKLIKIEAASKGMDVISLTKNLALGKEQMPLNDIVTEWNKKYKISRGRHFDFP